MKTPRVGRNRWGIALALSVAMLAAGASWAAAPESSDRHEARNFDARVNHNVGFSATPTTAQQQAVERARSLSMDLAVTYEPTASAPRTLYNQAGYLTNGPKGRFDAMEVAMDYLRQNLDLLGLSYSGLGSYEVTDVVHSEVGGATHIYLRQLHQGLPLYNGQLQINVNRDGKILSVNNAFLNSLASAVNSSTPALSASDAIQGAADHLQIPRPRLTQERAATDDDPRQKTVFSARGFSVEPIEAQLMWLPIREGDARLVWNFQVVTVDGNHWYDMTVDAATGQIWTRFDWTNSGTYRVYPEPLESPDATTPLPPADARSLIVNPENATASPNGWFTGGVMSGNNVHSCADANANNGCDTPEPTCSGTTCDFAIDLTAAPSASTPAAIANLFYWNNLIHDVQYQYGFDEVGGNFQENNFGNGGAGSDGVNADAQDGSGNCNANFATPTDGGNPRMQMFLCTNASPARDGDYDNGVIVHEYGHGISIRQVGGPGNSSCLNNSQQAGEGWSDWLALVYTAEASHTSTLARGLGSYLFNATTTIRDLPYSTDSGINNWTYESISGSSIPHGVGSRWAQGAWEVYWALVDKWGFEGDLVNFDINDPNEAGNKRALFYINEGLKNTACSPTFVNNRDGIIQAATDSFGGADVCDIWQAFADFGLGTDAVSGGSGSTNPTNGFSVPAACQCSPQPIADAGPDPVVCQGDSATIGTAAQPSNTYSWAPGGETTAQITVTPAATTTYTVTASTTCGSASDSVTVFVDDGSGTDFTDDFEGDTSAWTTSGLWHKTANSACASPGYSSAVNSFYYGQDASCNYDTGATTTGNLTSPSISGITANSVLSFQYYRVVESFNGNFDRTEVEIVSSSGTTTVFALDSSTASTAAWVNSGDISLAAFAGQSIQVRFVFNSGDSVSNNFTGWFIDDVAITGGESNCGPGNTAPTVTITAPADGSSSSDGDSVTFTGVANDTEDGDISGSLNWTSSLDGSIGSGGTFSTSALSVGTHTITASATDSGGLSGSDSITVTVNGVNTAPVVTITAPADGSTSTSGDSVTFAGTANDNEDGTITASLGWTSNVDGSIGSGGTFSTSSLSVGAHTITASVTDSGGLSGSAAISITVTQPANTPPQVNITAPGDGSTSGSGASVTFSGTANDTEDGDISAALAWTSDLDGSIGSGGTFSTSSLSVGTHSITASATDSGGLTGTDSISISVTAVQPVTVTFTSIADHDGWVRESNETSGVGGARNITGGGARALRPGDANQDRQYKAIVSFDTSSIPAGATVTAATLRLTRGQTTGTDPFTILGDLGVDISTGGFGGDVALTASDFQAAASASGVATMSVVTAQFQVSEGNLNAAGLGAIDLSGVTQLRISFAIDDNDDGGNDYVGFYSANNGTASRHPQLVVTYIP
ncbi:MAG: M36 family metallopeptidase [Deltaproteobacteria bacterium]|nr:M36 family metallopeptidase [Deltaproteobacteria bacterium]